MNETVSSTDVLGSDSQMVCRICGCSGDDSDFYFLGTTVDGVQGAWMCTACYEDFGVGIASKYKRDGAFIKVVHNPITPIAWDKAVQRARAKMNGVA